MDSEGDDALYQRWDSGASNSRRHSDKGIPAPATAATYTSGVDQPRLASGAPLRCDTTATHVGGAGAPKAGGRRLSGNCPDTPVSLSRQTTLLCPAGAQPEPTGPQSPRHVADGAHSARGRPALPDPESWTVETAPTPRAAPPGGPGRDLPFQPPAVAGAERPGAQTLERQGTQLTDRQSTWMMDRQGTQWMDRQDTQTLERPGAQMDRQGTYVMSREGALVMTGEAGRRLSGGEGTPSHPRQGPASPRSRRPGTEPGGGYGPGPDAAPAVPGARAWDSDTGDARYRLGDALQPPQWEGPLTQSYPQYDPPTLEPRQRRPSVGGERAGRSPTSDPPQSWSPPSREAPEPQRDAAPRAGQAVPGEAPGGGAHATAQTPPQPLGRSPESLRHGASPHAADVRPGAAYSQPMSDGAGAGASYTRPMTDSTTASASYTRPLSDASSPGASYTRPQSSGPDAPVARSHGHAQPHAPATDRGSPATASDASLRQAAPSGTSSPGQTQRDSSSAFSSVVSAKRVRLEDSPGEISLSDRIARMVAGAWFLKYGHRGTACPHATGTAGTRIPHRRP